VPVSGGETQQLSDKHLTWPAVSPDGNWIACALTLTPQKSRLAIISIDGGQPAKLFEMAPLGNIRLGFRWSNDGQSIIYRDQRIGLWRQSINGGAPKRVQGIPSEKIYGFAWSRDNKLFAYTLGAEMRDVVLVSTANTSLDFISASH
jgi:Tol biopolymer transport system component